MCRSRRELSNAYSLAKIGVDTAENDPLEVWGENSIQYSLHSLGESGGIVALMEGIKADIDKDIRTADKEESDAQAAYDKLCSDIDRTIAQLKSTRSRQLNKDFHVLH